MSRKVYLARLAKTFDIHIDWRDCWDEACEYKKQEEGDTE